VVSQLQACPDGQRLYPHIAQGSDPAVIEGVRGALRQRGFIVPRVEEIASRMPTHTEVRYFRQSESAGANVAVETLKAAGLSDVSAKYIDGYEGSKNIRLCHYELWIGRGSSGARP
jgi:hypothetical protein